VRGAVLLLTLAMASAAVVADTRASKRDAEMLRQKVATINAHAERPNP
jgi:hypothetical protein